MGKSAIEGLSLIKADDIGQEADIIANVMRKTLETKGRTAMLVTPDRKLARQVRAALLKWNLDIEDSAGTEHRAGPKQRRNSHRVQAAPIASAVMSQMSQTSTLPLS